MLSGGNPAIVPPLLTRMSTRSTLSAHRLDKPVERRAVGEITTIGAKGASLRLDRCTNLAPSVERRAHSYDVGAGACERDGGCLSDSPACSR